MANTDLYWGLKPLHMKSAEDTAMWFPFTNNYGTATFIYDPVALVATGSRIEKATAGYGNLILGSVLGIARQALPKSIFPRNLEAAMPNTVAPYLTASIGTTYEYFALVAVDPDLFFVMQEDGDTSDLDVDSSGLNCDVIAPGTPGNTTTGHSHTMLDSSSANSGNTRQMKLIQPYNWFDHGAGAYNTFGDYCKWVVKINYHQLASAITGV